MNKAELIEVIVKETGLTKAKSGAVLAVITASVIRAVTKGQTVQLIGFGTFLSGKRAARAGRNPQTGAQIKIAAAKTVRFRVGKAFKDAVNKRK